MKVSAIVALDEKRGIGKDNTVPWHIKEDLVRLKNLTVGHVVILGRTTYESMLGYYSKSGKPTMSQRTHIVITSDKNYVMNKDHGFAVHSPEEALEKAEKIVQQQDLTPNPLLKGKEDQGGDTAMEIFILGGAKVFTQMLQYTDRLYLTLVEGDYECDTFFPDYSQYTVVLEKEEKTNGNVTYTFLTLEK